MLCRPTSHHLLFRYPTISLAVMHVTFKNRGRVRPVSTLNSSNLKLSKIYYKYIFEMAILTLVTICALKIQEVWSATNDKTLLFIYSF